MAGAFHLVGHTNKTCRENKARYFMPTYILRIKDSEAPSFKLSLNKKGKPSDYFKLQLKYLGCLAAEGFYFSLPIIIVYYLYFLDFLCDH